MMNVQFSFQNASPFKRFFQRKFAHILHVETLGIMAKLLEKLEVVFLQEIIIAFVVFLAQAPYLAVVKTLLTERTYLVLILE